MCLYTKYMKGEQFICYKIQILSRPVENRGGEGGLKFAKVKLLLNLLSIENDTEKVQNSESDKLIEVLKFCY